MLSDVRFFIIFSLISSSVQYLFPIEPRNPLSGIPSPPGTPWPLPQDIQASSTRVSIGTETEFNYKLNVHCEPLEWAIEKFSYKFLFGNHVIPDLAYPTLAGIYINITSGNDVNQCEKFPRFSKNPDHEAYKLSISIENLQAFATVSATTVWGGLRGIETFSQLWYTSENVEKRHFYANVTEIRDWPRFPHRGIMIDTARHFVTVPTILQILDAMYYNKFNTLHWHIVDDQSFPFVSTTFPKLSQKGAYHSKAIYTPSTIQKILQEARFRGIRIVFEFDTPGHTHAIGKGYPEILTPCFGDGKTPGTPDHPNHAAFENLDPTRETTYDFIAELFKEIWAVSEDEFLHLGMDEVYYPCWNSSPVIKEFMNSNGYTKMSQVQAHYTNRHVDMITEIGAKSIIWQDPIDAGVELDQNVVIQVWKDFCEGGWPNCTQSILDKGHQIILSAPWYLNYIGYGQTWRQYYQVDPIRDLPNLKQNQKDMVLGGEVCMWAEFVDSTNIIPRLFPFASAVAERLWSNMNVNNTDNAMWRLDEHRCRLVWRGIPAQPILNGYCGQWEVDLTER